MYVINLKTNTITPFEKYTIVHNPICVKGLFKMTWTTLVVFKIIEWNLIMNSISSKLLSSQRKWFNFCFVIFEARAKCLTEFNFKSEMMMTSKKMRKMCTNSKQARKKVVDIFFWEMFISRCPFLFFYLLADKTDNCRKQGLSVLVRQPEKRSVINKFVLWKATTSRRSQEFKQRKSAKKKLMQIICC